jgi:hypothetical protein
MSQNPLNLALRFALEIAALVALGYGGWHAGSGLWRFVLMIALPLLAALLWGGFRPPDEPHHPTQPRFAVSGKVRLLIEALVFGGGAWGLFSSGLTTLGWIYTIIVIVHYALSYDRMSWLLSH